MSRHHNARAQASARRALVPLVASGNAVCWRCGLPIGLGQLWDAGHPSDLALGGHPAGRTLPEHALKVDCPEGGNRAAGARLGNQLRRRGRRRLDEWLRFFPPRVLPQPLAASRSWSLLPCRSRRTTCSRRHAANRS